MSRSLTALLSVTALVAAAGSAAAAPALGLVGDKTLVMIDTDTATVTATMDVTGVDSLLGIDLRPSNGMVYGVAADGHVVTIDLATGAATVVSMLETMVPAGMPTIVDFNPAADKLRFMAGTTNLRADVDTGKVTTDGSLAFQGGDMHHGEAPAIVAAAYINSFGKPEATKMYDIDATIVALIQQVSPNDGTLGAIGKLGIDGADHYAFDVQTTADGTNTAWLAAGGMLHTVDLETGKVSGSWAIQGAPGAIRDITILPEG